MIPLSTTITNFYRTNQSGVTRPDDYTLGEFIEDTEFMIDSCLERMENSGDDNINGDYVDRGYANIVWHTFATFHSLATTALDKLKAAARADDHDAFNEQVRRLSIYHEQHDDQLDYAFHLEDVQEHGDEYGDEWKLNFHNAIGVCHQESFKGFDWDTATLINQEKFAAQLLSAMSHPCLSEVDGLPITHFTVSVNLERRTVEHGEETYEYLLTADGFTRIAGKGDWPLDSNCDIKVLHLIMAKLPEYPRLYLKRSAFYLTAH